MLKCLTQDQHNVEEVVLPEVSYTSIFTVEWLEFINSERIGVLLENCLLTSDDQLFRVPWDMVVHPEFVEKTAEKTTETREISDLTSEPPTRRSSDPHMGDLMVLDNATILEEPSTSYDPEPVLKALEPKSDNSSDVEGEYVVLRDIRVPRFGPQKGSLTQSIALNYKGLYKPTQRAQNSQIVCNLGSRQCTGLHSSAVETCEESTIMGASVTHYNADHAQKPESFGLVDIEFGGRESPLPDHATLIVDNGSKPFYQDFNVENEASYKALQHVEDSTTDDNQQPSSESVNYANSLEEETQNHLSESIKDNELTDDQELVPDHSRASGCPNTETLQCSSQGISDTCAHQATTGENDQNVPLLVDEANQETNTDVIDVDVIAEPDKPVFVEEPFLADTSDQNGQVEGDRQYDLASDICGEQLEGAVSSDISGATSDSVEESEERTQRELQPCNEGDVELSSCPQNASCLLSPSSQLPLETLHEDTEEEQGEDGEPQAETAGPPVEEVVTPQNAVLTGKVRLVGF